MILPLSVPWLTYDAMLFVVPITSRANLVIAILGYSPILAGSITINQTFKYQQQQMR